jgi:Flp pilus assembly protein TadG
VILWWVGNAVLLLALPIVLVEAFRIMRSLSVVTAAARDIADSVQAVARSVPPAMSTVGAIAQRCRTLESAVAPMPG